MKLHLPKQLLAAVLLCFAPFGAIAYATTEPGDTTQANGLNEDGAYVFYSPGAFSDIGSATTVIVNTGDLVNGVTMGANAYNVASLTIESGLVTTGRNDKNGCISGDITIKGGGKLEVNGTGQDAFGHKDSNGNYTDNITLQGNDGTSGGDAPESGPSYALLDFDLQENKSSVTMSSNLTLNGYAKITGEKGFNTYGGSITVSGTDNTIGHIVLRDNVTMTLAAGSALSVEEFTDYGNGGRRLTIGGSGILTITGQSELKDVYLAGGSLVVAADTTMGQLRAAQGARDSSNLTVNAGVTLTVSDIANNYGITTMLVDGVLNASGAFLISTGNITNTITGSGTINAASLSVANITTKAAFSGVTLNLGSGGITASQPIEFGNMTVGVREDADGWSTSTNNISLAGTTSGTKFAPGEGKSITISGNMGGTGKLVKTGGGTLLLSGANTYSGGTTVEDGILEAASAGALGSGGLTISGGELRISVTGGAGLTIASGSIGSGAILNVPGTLTTTGTLEIDGLYIGFSDSLRTSGEGYITFGANAVIDITHLTSTGGGSDTDGFTSSSYRVTGDGVATDITGDTIRLVFGTEELGNGTWNNGVVTVGDTVYNVAVGKSYSDYLAEAQATGQTAARIVVQDGGIFTADQTDQTVAITGTGRLKAAWEGRAQADAAVSNAAKTFNGNVVVKSGTSWLIGDGYSFSSVTVESGRAVRAGRHLHRRYHHQRFGCRRCSG